MGYNKKPKTLTKHYTVYLTDEQLNKVEHLKNEKGIDFPNILRLTINNLIKVINDNNEENKMNIEQIKQIIRVKNGIECIKNINPDYIKDGFKTGQDLLFFNNGNECKFGFDSGLKLQIKNGFCKNKTDVLNDLNNELNNLKH